MYREGKYSTDQSRTKLLYYNNMQTIRTSEAKIIKILVFKM